MDPGLGIALAVLNLAVLVIAWRHLGRSGSLQGAMGTLCFGLAVLPLVAVFFGYAQGMAGMETVRACGGCHVMAGRLPAFDNELIRLEARSRTTS